MRRTLFRVTALPRVNPIVRLLLIGVVAFGISSGVASADQSPAGHLGNPDDITKSSGTYLSPVSVATAECPGFAPGDTLAFYSASYTSLYKFWQDSPAGAEWAEVSTKLSGSVDLGGAAYTFRANFFVSTYAIVVGDGLLGTGKVVITRSDGAKVTGYALGYFDPFAPFFGGPTGELQGAHVLSWQEVSCK